MKKSNYIKLSLLSFLTFSLLISCGPGKTVVKEVKTNQENVVEVITPCVGDKFQSNDKYFRGTANGSSVTMNMAKKIALRSANTFLATDIKLLGILASFFVSIIDNFASILGRQFFLRN